MSVKKIISLTLAVIMLIFSAIPVSASDNHSEVYSDLSLAVLNGKKFDFANYPKDTTDTGIYLLTVNEWRYNPSDMSEYAFYIYLYNPSGQAISTTSSRNKIQLATAWTDDSQTASRYSKFDIEFVSVSNEEGYEYVFYKAKIGNTSGGSNTLASYLNATRRRYEISGFELQRVSSSYAHEYTVGMRYDYFGSESAGSKTCQASQIDTIELDVHHTYFRTESSAADVNHYNQLNAVYFNVPAKYWNEYERLYSIQCEWEEYRTTPMIVTDNVNVHAYLTTWRGKSNGDGYNSSNPLSLYSGFSSNTAGLVTKFYYDWTYNVDATESAFAKVHIADNTKALAWNFYSSKIELRKTDISSQEVMDYWDTYKDQYRDYLITEEGVTDFDVEVDGVANRKAGYQYHDIAFDETFSMYSYASNHGWLQQLFNYNIFNGGAGTNLKDTYTNILAIQEVSKHDINMNAESLAVTYYVNPADADHFKETVKEGFLTGMKTIVFRFAVTDYFAEEVTAMINNSVVGGTTYRAEQTVFLNFDVISLTFEKDTNHYVIPVSSSSTDFIGGITAPQVDKDSGLQYLPGYVEGMWENMQTMMQRMFMMVLSVLLIVIIAFFLLSMLAPQNPVVVKINETAAKGADKITGKNKDKGGGSKK